MGDGAMLRFLELLRKELGAADTRAEIGGRAPTDPAIVWTELSNGWRIVALFDEAPADPAAAAQKLGKLVDGFSHTLGSESNAPPAPPVDTAFRRLDAALEGLRSRAGAVGVVLIDVDSPVLWGSSEPQRHIDEVDRLISLGEAVQSAQDRGLDIDSVLALESSDLASRLRDLGVGAEHAGLLGRELVQQDEGAIRRHLLTALAIMRARREASVRSGNRWALHEPQFGYFVRGFANIYLLVMVFEGAFSELHAESAVVHALPNIEQLVLALPPFDPPPRAGRVVKLRR